MMISGFPDERTRTRYLETYAELSDWPVPGEDRMIGTSFGATHVHVCGDGVPLVLLHGMMVTSLSWRDHVAGLAPHYRLYAVDSLGEPGRSVQTAPMPDAQSCADWLAEVLDRLGHDRVHLAGISRGGWLALNLAARRPDRVAGVTAFDPAGLAPIGRKVHLWIAAGLALMLAPRAIRHRFRDGRFSAYLDERNRRLILAQFAHRTKVFMVGTLTDDQWRSIAVPVTVVLGDHSVLHDAHAQRERLRALAPAVTVEVVPGGHDLKMLGPEFVVDRIRAAV